MNDITVPAPSATSAPSDAVSPGGTHGVGPAVGVLAAAFQDDPLFGWCLPDPARRAQVLVPFFDAVVRAVAPERRLHLTAEATGAALWVPPGCAPVPDDREPDFEAELAELFGADGDRAFALMGMLAEHHPTEPTWFLWFLGVRPGQQGRGTGSQLLRAVLDRCDAEGTNAYLDATSEGSRRLYQRHGFEVVAERSTDGSPPLWAMWRRPVVA